MRSAIWYPLYNLKNVKNTHGGVLTLVKQAKDCNITRINTLLPECFSRFLNCTNGTKSHKAPHITKSMVALRMDELILTSKEVSPKRKILNSAETMLS